MPVPVPGVGVGVGAGDVRTELNKDRGCKNVNRKKQNHR